MYDAPVYMPAQNDAHVVLFQAQHVAAAGFKCTGRSIHEQPVLQFRESQQL